MVSKMTENMLHVKALQMKDDPYDEPAHWYEDEDDAAEPESAYPYWEDDTDVNDFAAYVTREWAKKNDVDATAETALEAAELERVACLHHTLVADCCENPDTCADFLQTGAAAFLATKKGKDKSKGKGKGKYPIPPSNLSIERTAESNSKS